MFKHSVKVARLYKVAANIAKDVNEGKGSVKQMVYENKKKHPNIKAVYALVATVFQKSDEIESLLKRSQFLKKETRLDPWLTKVLIVELLWGKKRLPGESKPEKTIRAYEQIFKAHLNDVCLPTDADKSSKVEIKPRYVRVNTLNASLSEAVDGFRDEGWDLCKFLDKTNYKGFLSKVATLAENEFLVDIHIPNLLVFPPKTQFYNHPAYRNGSIVFQDKASCLPVHILGPEPGSIVLDMCAAPGMKTTQAAAVMNNEGTIYAVEMNPRRFETLNAIVDSSGATCVRTINKDVLTCSGTDFPGVQYILVDPSCTGSGMTDRLEFEQKASQDRIQRLAGFQIKILRSALTKYPDAKRVVYSTCSIFPEENEDVVRQVLETNFSFKLVPAKHYVNNIWTNFGSPDFGDIGKFCLYAKPDEDFTNGFFVAVFERLEEGEKNDLFNTKIYNYKKHVQSQETRRSKKQQEFDEKSGEYIQQHEDDMVGIVYEDATVDTGNDIHGSEKRKKKKNAKNDFIGNGDTRIESNSNVEVTKMDNIQENNEITANKELESVFKWKGRKGEVVDFANKTETIIEEKHKKKKRKESHSGPVENRDEENSEPVKHKKKKKDLHIKSTETLAESTENVNLEKFSNEFTVMKTQTKKSKPDEHNLELIEQSDEIKRKKKKHHENKKFECTAEDNVEAIVGNHSNEFPTKDIHISKKKRKNKKSHFEPAGTVLEEVNLTKSNVKTLTEKRKTLSEPHDGNLELIDESNSTIVKKKKKKHRGNEESESTALNNDEVNVVNDNSDFFATEIHISKKKKKRKESQGEEAVIGNSDSVNIKKKKVKSNVNETVHEKGSNANLMDVELITKKKKKKISNC